MRHRWVLQAFQGVDALPESLDSLTQVPPLSASPKAAPDPEVPQLCADRRCVTPRPVIEHLAQRPLSAGEGGAARINHRARTASVVLEPVELHVNIPHVSERVLEALDLRLAFGER